MGLKFTVVFKSGPTEVARVVGIRDVDAAHLTVEDIQETVIKTEAFLERLTGLRVHIESESTEAPFSIHTGYGKRQS